MTTRNRSTKRSQAKGAHALLETITLSGTAVGTIAGAIGGPAGAIAGGAIGTAVGLIVGATVEDENKRADAHDRELDAQIGVEGGDLGAREMAASGLSGPGTLLRHNHARLEIVYGELLDAFHEGEWDEVRNAWTKFETGLLAHLATEEADVFPRLALERPEEVDALIREHEELRPLLANLGVGVDLHMIRENFASALIERLRAHAKREEGLAYRWADASLTAADLHWPLDAVEA